MTREWQRPFAKPDRLSESVVYTVLSNYRRRSAIEELRGRTDDVTLRELSERLAARESGRDPAPRKLRESVYGSLHQTHLPTLDRHGLVDYDHQRKHVRPRARTRDLGPYLEVQGPLGATWAGLYQWLGIVGLFLVVASLVGTPVVRLVPPVVLGSVFLALFAGASAYRLWRLRRRYRPQGQQ
ncbi:MAG: hypothetical protein V5A43_08280 [Haloarculaceae archaeon]